MSDHSKIEWTDATWNVITGCSVTSPGCKNCYAMKLAGTRLRNHPSRAGLTRESAAGPVWTGEVRFNAGWLTQPMHWTRPRMVFVCAHGDLFHESVPDEWIDKVFAVMARARHHTFQVLTKRTRRMRKYFAAPHRHGRVLAASFDIELCGMTGCAWPLPNVWIGASVEHQKRADERIPDLLACPAAIHWISAEPLLSAIDLDPLWLRASPSAAYFAGKVTPEMPEWTHYGAYALRWVVAGGESGPNARPVHPDWVRSLRDQCAAAGVPFVFKQWGEWLPGEVYAEGSRGGLARHQDGSIGEHGGRRDHWWSGGTFGGHISTLIGKKAAGRLLDGRTHDEFPKGAA